MGVSYREPKRKKSKEATFLPNPSRSGMFQHNAAACSAQWVLIPYEVTEFSYFVQIAKGHLISKCPFGVFKSPKKNEIFSRISALASKKRSNQKNKGTLLY